MASSSSTNVLQEDFEDATVEYTTSVVEFSDGSEDYFIRTDGSDIASAMDYMNPVGTSYFAAHDIDGEGATLPVFMNFDNIDITGLTNIEFCVYIAEDDDGSNEDWDVTDYVHFDYDVDNSGSYSPMIWVESEPDGDNFNAVPKIDTDFDGDGDGAEITDAFTQYCFSIPGSGSDLDIQIEFQLNSGDEDIAIDEVTVTGDLGGGSDCVTDTAPSNLSESDITDTEATLSWDPVADADSYDVAINGDTVNVTDTFYMVTGLSPNTSYDWNVRVTCNDNTSSDWSASSNFTTAEGCDTDTAPSNLSESNISYNSATLSWDSVPNADSYDVAINGDTVSVADTFYNVTGLMSGTSYDWNVRVVCDAGGSSDWANPGGNFMTTSCPNPGDIIITEIMQNPSAVGDSDGEYFEVYNTTGSDIDINGWTIKDDGIDSHVIDTNVIVPAGGYAVLGINEDTSANGGINLDYAYGAGWFLSNGEDEVVLECSGTEIDRVNYDGGPNFPDPTGASMSLDPDSFNSTDNDSGDKNHPAP
jgi:chitodextrinase